MFLSFIKDSCSFTNSLLNSPSSWSLVTSPLNCQAALYALELFMSVYIISPSNNIGSLLLSTTTSLISSKASLLFGFSNKSSEYL